MTTIAAKIGTTDWDLTGIRSTTETKCDHCGRKLKNLYDVRNTITGQTMTIGRGCCKKVTGWTLTAAQAAHALRFAEAQARAAATWTRYEQAHPECAARILRDRHAELSRSRTATYSGGGLVAQHHRQISTGIIPEHRWAEVTALYMPARSPENRRPDRPAIARGFGVLTPLRRRRSVAGPPVGSREGRRAPPDVESGRAQQGDSVTRGLAPVPQPPCTTNQPPWKGLAGCLPDG